METLSNTNTKNFTGTKIILCLIAVYIGIAYGFFTFSSPRFSYRENNIVTNQFSILLSPLSELFANGKVSHDWDWVDIEQAQISTQVQPLLLSSKNPQYREYNKSSYKNILASIGFVSESAIISPVSRTDSWSLIYCVTKENFCQKSNIVTSGNIKILVDGQIKVWGIKENNTLIQLKLDSYISTSDRKDLVFI